MVGFPLLLIPLAIYNIVVWLMPGVSMSDALFNVPVSGTAWPVTLADILLALGMLLLLLEVIRGARPGAKFVMDHLLSFVVFAAAAAEFWLLPTKFANSTFFLLTLLALVDFLAGIAQRARRPRYQHAHGGAVEPSRRAPPAEPRVEAPRPPPPSPAPTVETVPAESQAPASEQPGIAQEREPSGGATEEPPR